MKKILALIIFALLMVSCTNTPIETYVDVDRIAKSIKIVSLKTKVDEFVYDNKSYRMMTLSQTISDKYFYNINSENNYSIDLQSGRISGLCHIAGCAHSTRSVGCLNHYSFISPVASANGIYYIDGNKVMLHNDKGDEIIFENNFCTEFENDTYPDNKHDLGGLMFNGEQMYIIAPTYYFTFDMKTKNVSEPKVISNSIIYSFCIADNKIYFTTENDELFCCKVENEKPKKLLDNVTQDSTYEGEIYFIKHIKGTPNLCRLDKETLQPIPIIEDCYVTYCINSGYVYYQSFISGRDCYCCKLDGSNKKKLKYNYTEKDSEGSLIPYEPNGLFTFATAPHIDRVFLEDVEGSIVFSAKAGSDECMPIEMGGVTE